MVVGNMLNNKSWVLMRHNPLLSKEAEDIEVTKKVEEEIIKAAFNCWKMKFN